MRGIAVGWAAVLLALSACSSKQEITATNPALPTTAGASLALVAAGIALPAGYKVDTERTMVFGTTERWTGRLSYTTTTGADDVFEFLHREMPNFGWTELTAMRSDTSLITFSSESTGRMATINISRGSVLGSTRVEMVVSPRDPNAP